MSHKIFTPILILVGSTLGMNRPVFAFPNINDSSILQVTETQSGKTQTTLETSKIIELNSEKNFAKVNHMITQNQEVLSQETETLTLDDLMEEYNVLDHCSELASEGAYFTKITLLGIQWSACYLKSTLPLDEEGNETATLEVWYGKVPFGVLKSTITAKGYRKDVILKAFTDAKH